MTALKRGVKDFLAAAVLLVAAACAGFLWYRFFSLPASTDPSSLDPDSEGFDGDPARQGLPKPVRYHNPGAIMKAGTMIMNYYPDDETGTAAMLRLLNSYVSRGFDTIGKIVPRWAGTSAGSYVSFVSQNSGIPVDSRVVESNRYDYLSRIAYRMHRFEAGRYWLPESFFRDVAGRVI
jgi:hypothetical protein